MKVFLVKHRFKQRKYFEVVSVCATAELAKQFIDNHKEEPKYNGLWSLSDRTVLEEV